jgi:hypothetical protein
MMHIHVKYHGFYQYDLLTKMFHLVYGTPYNINYPPCKIITVQNYDPGFYHYQSYKDSGWVSYMSKRDFEMEIYRWKAERV